MPARVIPAQSLLYPQLCSRSQGSHEGQDGLCRDMWQGCLSAVQCRWADCTFLMSPDTLKLFALSESFRKPVRKRGQIVSCSELVIIFQMFWGWFVGGVFVTLCFLVEKSAASKLGSFTLILSLHDFQECNVIIEFRNFPDMGR